MPAPTPSHPQQLPKCLSPMSLPQRAGPTALFPTGNPLSMCALSHPVPKSSSQATLPKTCLLRRSFCPSHPPYTPERLATPFSQAGLGWSWGRDCHSQVVPRVMLAIGACPAGAALAGCIPPQNVLMGDRTLAPAFGQRLGCLRDAGTPAASETVAVLLATGFL